MLVCEGSVCHPKKERKKDACMSLNSIFCALFVFHCVSFCFYIAFIFFCFFFPVRMFVMCFSIKRQYNTRLLVRTQGYFPQEIQLVPTTRTQHYISVTHMSRMFIMSHYLCTHAKHRRSGDWSAANSSTSSCVIIKNSMLMLSACMQ